MTPVGPLPTPEKSEPAAPLCSGTMCASLMFIALVQPAGSLALDRLTECTWQGRNAAADFFPAQECDSGLVRGLHVRYLHDCYAHSLAQNRMSM